MTPIDYNDPNDMWRHNGYDPYKGLIDEERLKAGCFQLAAFFVMIMVVLALCALLGSCTTTKYVPVIEHKTDTVIQTNVQKDSIWLYDSIHVTEKGDTVRIEKWHTKYIEKQVHDTLYQSKTDSVPVPYPVEKFVEKQLAWWQKALMYVGALSLLLFCLWFWKTK